MKCPGCGLERRNLETPCSVCGAVFKAPAAPVPAPAVEVVPTPIIQAVPVRIAHTPGRPVCLHCGGDMQKKLINPNGCVGGVLAVLFVVVGIGLLVAPPMGAKLGGVLLIGLVIASMTSGPKVLRCKSCGASAKME